MEHRLRLNGGAVVSYPGLEGAAGPASDVPRPASPAAGQKSGSPNDCRAPLSRVDMNVKRSSGSAEPPALGGSRAHSRMRPQLAS